MENSEKEEPAEKEPERYGRYHPVVSAATGWKVTKITAICAALTVPGLNVAVGSLMVAKMISSGVGAFNRLN